MRAQFSKDAFLIGEKTSVPIDVDNTNCSADILAVRGTLAMILVLQAKHYTSQDQIKLSKKEDTITGAAMKAGQSRTGQNCL